jgi:hypothetical protein
MVFLVVGGALEDLLLQGNVALRCSVCTCVIRYHRKYLEFLGER